MTSTDTTTTATDESKRQPSTRDSSGHHNDEQSCPPHPLNAYAWYTGWYTKMSWSWLSPLLRLGAERPLVPTDLYELQREDEAAAATNLLSECWEREMAAARTRGSEPSLLRVLCRLFFVRLVKQTWWAFAESCCKIGSAVLTGELTKYFERDDKPFAEGVWLCVALLLCSHVVNFAHHFTFHRGFLTGHQVRVACVGLVYRKSLRLHLRAFAHTSEGQIVTLVSVDAMRFEMIAVFLPYLVIAPIEIAVIMYLLWQYVGVASVCGTTFMVLLVPLQSQFGRWYGYLRHAAASVTDTRVRLMSELLSGIRVVRMFVWELPYMAAVQQQRRRELSHIFHASLMKGFNSAAFFSGQAIVNLSVVAAYVWLGNELTPSTVFGALALLSVLRMTVLMFVPNAVEAFYSTKVSVERIRTFLLLEERHQLQQQPLRAPPAMAADAVKSDAVTVAAMAVAAAVDGDTAERASLLASSASASPSSSQFGHSNRVYGECKLSSSSSTPSSSTAVAAASAAAATTSIAPSQSLSSPPQPMLHAHSLSRGWGGKLTSEKHHHNDNDTNIDTDIDADAAAPANGSSTGNSHATANARTTVFQNVSFSLDGSGLVCVVGPVGAGKTSLLLALLGEMTSAPSSSSTTSRSHSTSSNSNGDSNTNSNSNSDNGDTGGVCAVGSVAYACQTPFVMSGTVTSNICMGHPYDAERVRAAVEVCAMTRDVQLFPRGLDTEIGERGITLSGGQRARLGLARAVYAGADIYLLDDPLSAVDPAIGRKLFADCITGGSGGGGDVVDGDDHHKQPSPMALGNKIVVLVTHQTHFLTRCQHVIVLNESGDVVEQGPFASLSAAALRYCTSDGHGDDDDAATEAKTMTPAAEASAATKNRELSGDAEVCVNGNDDANGVDAASIVLSSNDSNAEALSTEKTDGCKDDTDINTAAAATTSTSAKAGTLRVVEERAVGAVSRKTWSSYVKASGGWLVLLFVVVMGAVPMVILFRADFWLADWSTDSAAAIDMRTLQRALAAEAAAVAANVTIAGEEATATAGATTMAVSSDATVDIDNAYHLRVYAWLVLAMFVAALTRIVAFFAALLRGARVLHDDLLASVMHAPVDFYDSTPRGRLLNRFSAELGIIDELLPMTVVFAVTAIITVACTVVVACYINPYVTPILLPLLGVFIWARAYVLKTNREVKRLEGESRSPIHSALATTLSGLVTVRAYGCEAAFTNTFHTLQDANSRAFTTYLAVVRWLTYRLDALSTVFVSFTAFAAVLVRHDVDAGLIGLSLAYSIQLLGMFQWSVSQASLAEIHMTAVERVLSYCNIESEGRVETAPTSPLLLKMQREDWPAHGGIQIHNVSLSYRHHRVLHNISCTIAPREKVGVVGRTGAGKSSLMMSLLRLTPIDADGGRIEIDGIDIADIGLRDLRGRAIGVIPQEPTLFTGTVRHNLDPFDECTDDQLLRALMLARLRSSSSSGASRSKKTEQRETEDREEKQNKVEQTTTRDDDGYVVDSDFNVELDDLITEGGDNFSVGQAQLLCLARVIALRRRILIMDEATANVDARTDAYIQDTIRDAFADVTLLVIAHRLGTVIESDKIMVLDNGRLVEFGHPHVLLTQPSHQHRGDGDNGAGGAMGVFASMVAETGVERATQLRARAERAWRRTHTTT